MAQDSEDEVWEQILANANQLVFPEWESFPEDPQCADDEKITEDEKGVDSAFCSCDNRQEVTQQIMNEVFYVCSSNIGGCGKEIKK